MCVTASKSNRFYRKYAKWTHTLLHSWSASQVVGHYNVYPKYGDYHGTWAQAKGHFDKGWIEVCFISCNTFACIADVKERNSQSSFLHYDIRKNILDETFFFISETILCIVRSETLTFYSFPVYWALHASYFDLSDWPIHAPVLTMHGNSIINSISQPHVTIFAPSIFLTCSIL